MKSYDGKSELVRATDLDVSDSIYEEGFWHTVIEVRDEDRRTVVVCDSGYGFSVPREARIRRKVKP